MAKVAALSEDYVNGGEGGHCPGQTHTDNLSGGSLRARAETVNIKRIQPFMIP